MLYSYDCTQTSTQTSSNILQVMSYVHKAFEDEQVETKWSQRAWAKGLPGSSKQHNPRT